MDGRFLYKMDALDDRMFVPGDSAGVHVRRYVDDAVVSVSEPEYHQTLGWGGSQGTPRASHPIDRHDWTPPFPTWPFLPGG